MAKCGLDRYSNRQGQIRLVIFGIENGQAYDKLSGRDPLVSTGLELLMLQSGDLVSP